MTIGRDAPVTDLRARLHGPDLTRPGHGLTFKEQGAAKFAV